MKFKKILEVKGDPARDDDGAEELHSFIIKWTGSKIIRIFISTVE
jgi:hypothetical protein